MADALHSDIVIVGGGMVGTPLALMLAEQGWKVTLLDAAPQGEAAIPSALDQRCTAIAAGSVELFDCVGLWDAVSEDACAIKKVHVSQKGHFGTTRMDAEQHNIDALGYVVNNHHYLQSLRALLVQSPVVHVSNAKAYSYRPHTDHAVVGYESDSLKSQISAKLVIAVDGIASVMRDAVGIGISHYDYEQCAVLGCVSLSDEHENIAYERFAAGGPLAMLPRPGDIASFVYCIDAKRRATIEKQSPAEFKLLLQHEFGHRLGNFLDVGARTILPLTRIEAQMQQQDRLLLLGNAMRLIHPVAGQGYNLAMRDVAGLLTVLNESAPLDPGDTRILSQFVASREADQKRVVRLTDTLARSFRGYSSLPGHVRGMGLMAMAAVPLIGQRFSRQSLGYLSRSPVAR